MGERSLLLRALHEHRDRRPNALIDEHHENLVLVAKENRAAAAHRGYGTDLHFDNGFTHIANLVTRLPAKIRIAFKRWWLTSNKSTKSDTKITRRRDSWTISVRFI